MMKIHVIKEALIATSLIVGITFLISALPLKNEFLKGVRQDVNGFDVYDLTFNDDNKKLVRDTNIVIVEIGDSRNDIAGQINLIESYQPSVIGLDAFFLQAKDEGSDSLFLQTVSRNKNIVLGMRLDTINVDECFFCDGVELITVRNFFDSAGKNYHSGYINFVGDNYSVVRTYPPFETVDGKELPAFSSKILELFSKEKYERLRARKDEESVINYSGNVQEKYTSITKEQLLEFHETGQLSTILAGKIVLLGYFVKDGPLVLEDLHFSPLNKHIAGKGFPDMYGVVIHANILTMLIENKFASLASAKMAYFFAFLFTFLLLCYTISLYAVKSHPSHAKILLIQFFLILLVIYLFLQVFNIFSWKVPLSSIVISLVLCIELLGLYKLLATWLSRKFGYVTVFNKNPHV